MAIKVVVKVTGITNHSKHPYEELAESILGLIGSGEYGLGENDVAIHVVNSERHFSPLLIEWQGRPTANTLHLPVSEITERIRNLIYKPGDKLNYANNNVIVIGRVGREEVWLGAE